MENRVMKLHLQKHPNLSLKVIPGHYETSSSHVNYFIDINYLKTRHTEAMETAKAMIGKFDSNTIIDTIVCMDGCEAIGSYLAQELSIANFTCKNAHKAIYIVTPEYNCRGQMIFNNSLHSMIKNRHVLLLIGSTTTGITIRRGLECINYYGGKIQRISAIFSALDGINDIPIDSLFNLSHLPDYKTYFYHECPYCQKNIPLDSIVQGMRNP